MKKFGLSKKDKSAGGSPAPEDDPNRSALFGGRKAKSPPSGGNPYAQAGGNPYAQGGSAGGSYGGMGAPPAYDGQLSDRQRQEKSAVPPGGYGGGDRFAGSGGNYGSQGGYGGNRYGDSGYGGGGSGGSSASRRPGGYGGLGGDDGGDDPSRNALFGNAGDRYQQRTAQQSTMPSQQRQQGGYGQSGTGAAYGEDGTGYGAYQDRQLTAEEEEEEDVTAMKQQIRQMKQEDVSSTRNALRLAAQAEASGQDTLQRLGAQGERIHNTERHLDLASNQNKSAADKTKELKTLNKSMFAMHVSNPFTAQRRRDARDQAIMDRHHSERDAREATRQAAFESQQRQAETAKAIAGGPRGGGNQRNLAERSKYQFEADSEDEEMENEIDDNLDQLHGAAGRLGVLAKAMGNEVETQNKHIDRISGKTDTVDDQIARNRAYLDRIR